MSLSLPEKVLAIADALHKARIPHAFGGALALAYYAEPRATIDIDVNVFVPPPDHARVARALEPLGVKATDPSAILRDGQDRWRWDETPIDLFFSNDPIHDAMKTAARRVPFGDSRIPILAPEHLLVCKAAFGRPKDWLDIEQMILMTDRLDRDEVWEWMTRIAAADDPRLERLRDLLDEG